VELDRGITELEARLHDLEVFAGVRERHGRRVGGDLSAKPTDQLPCRNAGEAAGEVPQRVVDEAESWEGQLLCPVDLPHAMPEKLALEWVGSGQLVAEHSRYQILDGHRHAGSRRDCNACDSLVGAEAENGRLTIGWGAEQTATPEKRGIRSRKRDPDALDVRDQHAAKRNI